MITIVDYDRGNLFSLSQAMRSLGADFEVSGDPKNVRRAKKLLLPGVGAFGDGMARLREKGLVDAILDSAKHKTPILGICLGMQLFATTSEEFGAHEGLGFIPGVVRRLPESNDKSSRSSSRVPNIGWRKLNPTPLGARIIGPDQMTYFLHSYALEVEDSSQIMATIDFNGKNVIAAVRKENFFGYQFHPEKSGSVGISLIQHFINLTSNQTE
jgi:imidazole glycerol-phosphate synthase subunit HisH